MKSLVALTALLGSAILVAPALADGGYFSGTLGARAAGRAGAFTAKADDLSAVIFNPAGLANLETTLIEVGNQISYNAYSFARAPTRDYGQAGAPMVSFDKVSNGKPWQPFVPMAGVASKLGLRDWGFALAVYAPPGISQEAFPLGSGLGDGQRYMMIDRESIILNYVASAAWKYHELFGVGASAEWISVPTLNYSLVINGNPLSGASNANPVSGYYDMVATTKGSSLFTFNAILGAWYRPVPSLMFGLSGQVVPATVVTHSTLSISPINTADLGSSVLLTRNGVPANDVSLKFPLPMVGRAGARYRKLQGNRERFDIELDLEYVTWSRVKRFTIEANGLQANCMGSGCRGQYVNVDQINIEKHWRDTLGVKLGGDYAVMPGRLTLRAGGYYESAVADPAYANVDFPGGAQLGGAVGGSLFFWRLEVAVAYMLKVQPSVSVSEANARVYQQVPSGMCVAPYTDPLACNPNYPGQPSPSINAGTYTASSHLVSLDVLYRF